MISIAPLALLAILGMAIWAIADRRHGGSTIDGPYRGDPVEPATGEPVARPRMSDLHIALDRWLVAGLITRDQADAVARYEADRSTRPAPATRRIPLVAEALGYLGGSLGIVGLSLLTAHYWVDFPTWARLGTGIAAAVILTVAGALVPARGEAPLERLRQFVWTAAGAGVGLTAAVVAIDVADAHDGGVIALVVAGAVAVHSGALWRGAVRPMQQGICMIGGLVTVGAFVEQWANGGPVGLAVWLLGLCLVGFGVWHLVSTPELALLVGGAGAMVGTAILSNRWHGPGLLLGIGTAATFGALVLARSPIRARTDRVVLAVVATVGTLGTLGATLTWFARHAGIVTGLTLWAIGATALVAARTPAVRLKVTAQCIGGLALVGGGALTGAQSIAFATIFGVTMAVALVALGTLPDHAILSIFGSAGLLVNVPWAIHHFFPGEGRVPLLILVSGLLIVGVAVWLTHLGGELRHEFHLHLRHH